VLLLLSRSKHSSSQYQLSLVFQALTPVQQVDSSSQLPLEKRHQAVKGQLRLIRGRVSLTNLCKQQPAQRAQALSVSSPSSVTGANQGQPTTHPGCATCLLLTAGHVDAQPLESINNALL
jgi:hypothetical protein